MSDTQTAPEGTQPPNGAPEVQDPTAGFVTEEWEGGKQVESKSKPETPPQQQTPPVKPEGDAAKEGAGTADEGEEQQAQGDGQQPKKKGTFQERINELTRARHTVERENEELRQRLQALEQKVNGGKPDEGQPKSTESQPQARQLNAAASAGDPDAPDPTDFQKYEFGEIDPKYIADLASYSAQKTIREFRDQEAQQRQQDAEARRQTEALQRAEKQAEKAAEKYPDFVEKVYGGAIEGSYPLSQEMAALILESDVGHDVAYFLATNPDESRRIFALSPMEQVRQFGRMEAKFSAEQSAASTGKGTQETAPARITAAPAPLSAPRGGGGPLPVTADTDDFLSFERKANKLLGNI